MQNFFSVIAHPPYLRSAKTLHSIQSWQIRGRENHFFRFRTVLKDHKDRNILTCTEIYRIRVGLTILYCSQKTSFFRKVALGKCYHPVSFYVPKLLKTFQGLIQSPHMQRTIDYRGPCHNICWSYHCIIFKPFFPCISMHLFPVIQWTELSRRWQNDPCDDHVNPAAISHSSQRTSAASPFERKDRPKPTNSLCPELNLGLLGPMWMKG